MLELTTGVVFLMSSLYGSGQSENHVQTINADTEAGKATSTVTRSFTDSDMDMETYLRQEYADQPILVEIARCESEFRHYGDNGTVLRGRATPEDVGVMQINEYFHGETAKKMGIDIYTVDGNIEYAKYLYGKYGSKPWSASAPCWSKSRDIAKK